MPSSLVEQLLVVKVVKFFNEVFFCSTWQKGDQKKFWSALGFFFCASTLVSYQFWKLMVKSCFDAAKQWNGHEAYPKTLNSKLLCYPYHNRCDVDDDVSWWLLPSCYASVGFQFHYLILELLYISNFIPRSFLDYYYADFRLCFFLPDL